MFITAGRSALLLALGLAAGAGADPSPSPLPPVGEATAAVAAPVDWRLRTLDGRPASLADLRGRPVVVNVWATWCRPCVAELRGFQELSDSLAADGVAFVFVSPERAAPVRRFLERHRYALPVYLEEERMPPAIGAPALPTTVVLDHAGRVVHRHRGAADWSTPRVRAALRALARAADSAAAAGGAR